MLHRGSQGEPSTSHATDLFNLLPRLDQSHSNIAHNLAFRNEQQKRIKIGFEIWDSTGKDFFASAKPKSKVSKSDKSLCFAK